MLKLCRYASERIASLVNSKTAFNVSSFSGFNPFRVTLLLADFRIRIGFPKLWTVKMNVVTFAILKIFPCPEYGICKHTFWIMSISFSVILYGFLKRCAFIERIPA